MLVVGVVMCGPSMSTFETYLIGIALPIAVFILLSSITTFTFIKSKERKSKDAFFVGVLLTIFTILISVLVFLRVNMVYLC